MKIETKFDLFERFWVMHNNKPYNAEVQQIKIKVNGNASTIICITYEAGIADDILENRCFKTKQELIDSL